MIDNLSNKCLLDSLSAHYSIEVMELTLLPLGADVNASVYRVETMEQVSYFVKISTSHNLNSIAIMDLLVKAGMDQIIPPVRTLQGQPALQLNDFTLIVYPYVAGQDGFSRALSDHQWLALGKTLRKIHSIDVPQSLQHQIRRETYSPQWRNTVRSLLSNKENNHVDDEFAVKLWTFINCNLAAINRLVNRAEQLAHELQNETLEFVLCHSDIHGGNILIDEAEKAYIVDWDDPIMAPKERDLMFIGGGVGNIWNKPHEEKLFYEGYGKTEINMTALAYYRNERIVEDIAEFMQEVLFTNAKSEDKLVMYNHCKDMFQPKGVVEIAFKTDGLINSMVCGIQNI